MGRGCLAPFEAFDPQGPGAPSGLAQRSSRNTGTTVAPAWVFLVEVQTGWSIGWGTAALLYTLLSANLPEALTSRVMFWIGLAPAALVFWIRHFVDEPVIHLRAGGPAFVFGDEASVSGYNVAGGDDGYRGSGVELCAHDLPAAVFEDTASSDFGWDGQLLDGADPGGVLWVFVRRVSG
jgi:hypothetical protein